MDIEDLGLNTLGKQRLLDDKQALDTAVDMPAIIKQYAASHMHQYTQPCSSSNHALPCPVAGSWYSPASLPDVLTLMKAAQEAGLTVQLVAGNTGAGMQALSSSSSAVAAAAAVAAVAVVLRNCLLCVFVGWHLLQAAVLGSTAVVVSPILADHAKHLAKDQDAISCVNDHAYTIKAESLQLGQKHLSPVEYICA